VGPSYGAWKNFYFPEGGPDSGDLADSDGDGAGNLLEYSRGTDPTVEENQLAYDPVFALVNAGGTLHYQFTCPMDRPDAVYQVQRSTDMLAWEDTASVPVATENGMVTREVNLAVDPEEPATFLRLKVKAAP